MRDEFELLRNRAEKLHALQPEQHDAAGHSPDAVRKLVHELAVYRIELEMQHKELCDSRDELERSLECYRELYDSAPVGYLSIDRHSSILQANSMAVWLLGIEPHRLPGRDFREYIVAEDVVLFDTLISGLARSASSASCEVRIFCSNSPVAASLPGEPSDEVASAIRTVQIDAVAGIRPDEYRITLSDISERKRLEAERLEMQLKMAEAQKLESIGRLAGGIAHDFNNMLQIMLASIDLMERDRLLGRVDPDKLSDMRQCVMKSGELVRQLLAFARQQPARPVLIDFVRVVEDTIGMLRRIVGDNITLSLSRLSPGKAVFVLMDRAQMEQVVTNLILNARDAIAGDYGKIEIGITPFVAGPEHCPAFAGIEPGSSYVCLTVCDDGCGMDAHTAEKVFEPFFTTKAVGQGNGLGLSTVYGIVTQNQGFIRLASLPGKGTTFELILPHHEAPYEPSHLI